MPARKQNHYEVLGLWRDASQAEIRRAYRRLAMLHHPDVNSDLGAEERFRAIKEAYDVLSEPASRARFDATLGTGTSASRRVREARDQSVPGGWTPPWVQDWDAEAWFRASAGPPPWSFRALRAEVHRSWKTLAAYLAALALVITICGLLNWAVPVTGTIVVAAFFMLPFAFYVGYVFRGLRAGESPVHRVRRSAASRAGGRDRSPR